ncbi:hypothetical protein FSP39_005248 [Pinctada imbricata]|uniref:Uncharacterized protein n=1 Tax=Pinctada imbricata TaxID=66713 RepID=A0AA89C0U2_PINIB|nr:hypothetical protein FSP39_005248 [Pinctada imbricata]
MDTHQYRRVAVIALIAILCFVIGVLIGYFSMKKEHLKYCKDVNRKDAYPTNFNFLNRGADMSISKKIPGLVSRQRLDETIRFLTEKPRYAGTETQAEVTKFVHNTFLRHGFHSERVAYNVLLSFPRPGANSTITLIDDGGNELQKTSPFEEGVGNIKDYDDSFKAFNAYSPSGEVEGDLIYAEYGRKLEFERLKENGIDVTGKIAIIKYGKIFRGNKVEFAAKAGAVGVILYSDPGDYGVCCEGINPYPETAFLPLTGMQRGAIVLTKGDQTTPGYPSTEYAYRLNEIELNSQVPQIPSQPITATDAFKMLREMNGEDIVQDSLGRFNLSFPHGTGLKPGRKVNMVVKNINEMRKIENVIGTIRGSIEPDRYVIFGGHKDAWVYGGADPMSGTNIVLEVARVIGELVNQGWKPRRSIIICSWDGEEYGLIGSFEWVEENMAWIRDKVVAYINVDSSVTGNLHTYLRSVPLLKKVFVESTKIAADPSGQYDSVYDKWLDEEHGDIQARKMGGGSDFVPFLAVHGIPTMYPKIYGISKGINGQEWTARSTPLYHTRYETYHFMKMIDPEMKNFAAMTTILTDVLRQLADSMILPFDLKAFLIDLKKSVKVVADVVFIQNTKVDKKYQEGLQKGIENVDEAIAKFQNDIAAVDKNNPLAVRRVNDKMMALEKVFIDGNGLPDRPQYKKYIEKPRSAPIGDRKLQPIILSDSKGNWLKNHVSDDVEKQIIWQSKSGARIADSTNWLKRNIAKSIINYGDIWLYVWIGTCDLTSKNKKYISLRHNNEDGIREITTKYREINDIIRKYPGSKLTILETPIYSIKKWNEGKGHKDPATFEDQDEELASQINALNREAREINKSLGSHSPEFTSDLQTNRKVKVGDNRQLRTIKRYNFNLYADGIHTGTLLSKAWLKKITEQIKRDCWDKQVGRNEPK